MVGVAALLTPLVIWSQRPPKAGSACEKGTAECRDKSTGLVCGDDGKWALSECAGPLGCRKTGTRVRCDFSPADDGATCAPHEERQAYCRAGGQSMAICLSGTIRHVPCRGPFACKDYGKDRPVCDMIQAKRGERCFLEKDGGSLACEVGGRAVLKCDGEKWSFVKACKLCSSNGNVLDCD